MKLKFPNFFWGVYNTQNIAKAAEKAVILMRGQFFPLLVSTTSKKIVPRCLGGGSRGEVGEGTF